MGLLLLLALLGGAYAALNWFLLPRIERSWVTASTQAKYSKAGTIAALKTLRTFLQIAIVTAVVTLVVATVIWLGARIGWDLSLAALHDFTAWVLGWLKSLGESLGLALTWLGVAGLGWMAYRVARSGLRGDLDREFATQKTALAEQWREDKLPDLPPSAEMDACAEQLARAHALRDTLAQDPTGNQAALEALDETINKLVSFYINADLDRRVDLTAVPLPIDDGPGWWPRIRVLLFSKGTLKLGERTKTYVTRLATAAACFAVVGVSAPALANGAIAPLFASLTDLRVFASAERAARTLSSFARTAALPPAAAIAADDPSDEFEPGGDVYARTATHFVRALARPQVWVSGVEHSVPGRRVLAAASPRQQRDLGGMMIREALLREYSAGRPGAGLASEGLAGLADEGLQTRYDRMVDGLEPDPARRFSGLVGRVEGYLRAEGARRPGFEAQLRAGLAEFRQPVQVWDYASAALGDVVGDALKEALPEAGSDLTKLRPKIERTAIKTGVERLVEIKLAGFLENVRAGKPVAQSLGEVARPESIPTLRMAEARSMAGSFERLELDAADLRRGIDAKSPSLRIVVSEAERARVKPFAQFVREGLPARNLAGALGNYDALFEAHARSVSATALAEIDPVLANAATAVAEAAGSGGSSGGGGPSADRAKSPGRFQLARNSVRMGRSFRVGGVVIGAMPRSERPALDFERLIWTQVGGSFDLELVGHGKSTSLGRYSGETIQLALAYAADARTVAVTMTAPSPVDMPMLRVNLHPALLDTRLGHDVISVDRFVDEANALCEAGITKTQNACEERARVGAQLELYRIANLIFRREIDGASPGALQAAKVAPHVFPSDWDRSSEAASIFAYHPTYFDSALVGGLQDCAALGAEGYWKCIESKPSGSLLAQSPSNTIWSGVREEPYDLASGWLTRDRLRFMVQVAFDLGGADDEESASGPLDDGKSPWEFPTVANAIERDVAQLMANDGEHTRVAASVREFLRLQRIFRLALAGRMGNTFQMGDLIVLMREAGRADPVSDVPTPHWSRSRGEAREALTMLRLRQPRGEPSSIEDRMAGASLRFLEANLNDPAVRFSDE